VGIFVGTLISLFSTVITFKKHDLSSKAKVLPDFLPFFYLRTKAKLMNEEDLAKNRVKVFRPFPTWVWKRL
jgi:hypothetical protein